MSRFSKAVFSSLIFLLGMNIVSAASKCDVSTTADLNREVVNIKASYEEKEKIMDPSVYTIPDEQLYEDMEQAVIELKQYYFQINILNLSENFYIEVSNDVSGPIGRYDSSKAVNGVISIDWTNLSKVATFTIKVYASNATGCGGELYRTIYLTIPRYNDYSEYVVCNTLTDYYLCQKYVTFDEVDFGVFSSNVEKKLEEVEEDKKLTDTDDEDKWYTSAWNFIKEHNVAFIIGGISLIVIAGGVAIVIIRNRRRSII